GHRKPGLTRAARRRGRDRQSSAGPRLKTPDRIARLRPGTWRCRARRTERHRWRIPDSRPRACAASDRVPASPPPAAAREGVASMQPGGRMSRQLRNLFANDVEAGQVLGIRRFRPGGLDLAVGDNRTFVDAVRQRLQPVGEAANRVAKELDIGAPYIDETL